MKFLDENVNIEDLEQDEWTLSNPKHSKNENLRVLGICGRQGTVKLIVCECSECKKDPELFKNGLFLARKDHIKAGIAVCGCGKVTFSNEQHEVKVRRKCNETGNIIIHHEDFSYHSKVVLKCPHDGYEWSTSPCRILKYKDSGCKVCKYEKSKLNFTLTEEEIKRRLVVGNYPEKAKIESYTENNRLFYKYYCPVCADDVYSQNNIGGAWFKITTGALSAGNKPCRCGLAILNQEQKELQIRELIKNRNSDYEFVKWKDRYVNKYSIFIRNCKLHGEFETSAHNFTNANHGCPYCVNINQLYAYINYIYDFNNIIVGCKFGITSSFNERIKNQNRRNSYKMVNHSLWKYPTAKQCQDCEKYIKLNFNTALIPKLYMEDGYTETVTLDSLQSLIEVYRSFGGEIVVN